MLNPLRPKQKAHVVSFTKIPLIPYQNSSAASFSMRPASPAFSVGWGSVISGSQLWTVLADKGTSQLVTYTCLYKPMIGSTCVE